MYRMLDGAEVVVRRAGNVIGRDTRGDRAIQEVIGR